MWKRGIGEAGIQRLAALSKKAQEDELDFFLSLLDPVWQGYFQSVLVRNPNDAMGEDLVLSFKIPRAEAVEVLKGSLNEQELFEEFNSRIKGHMSPDGDYADIINMSIGTSRDSVVVTAELSYGHDV